MQDADECNANFVCSRLYRYSLPQGKSPSLLQKEHFEFLAKLKEIGISHGDFADL